MKFKAAMREDETMKQRANRAINALLRQKRLAGAFDNCFEMGDGDDVYREIMRRADKNPKIVRAIKEKGFGYWLEANYRKKHQAPQ